MPDDKTQKSLYEHISWNETILRYRVAYLGLQKPKLETYYLVRRCQTDNFPNAIYTKSSLWLWLKFASLKVNFSYFLVL